MRGVRQTHEILILDTYIDRAMTGTNDNRPDFQRMIKDSNAKNGIMCFAISSTVSVVTNTKWQCTKDIERQWYQSFIGNGIYSRQSRGNHPRKYVGGLCRILFGRVIPKDTARK